MHCAPMRRPFVGRAAEHPRAQATHAREHGSPLPTPRRKRRLEQWHASAKANRADARAHRGSERRAPLADPRGVGRACQIDEGLAQAVLDALAVGHGGQGSPGLTRRHAHSSERPQSKGVLVVGLVSPKTTGRRRRHRRCREVCTPWALRVGRCEIDPEAAPSVGRARVGPMDPAATSTPRVGIVEPECGPSQRRSGAPVRCAAERRSARARRARNPCRSRAASTVARR